MLESACFASENEFMKARQLVENESSADMHPLLGIEAQTGPYPAARSWSGGRRRMLGREVFETNTYHVMSRTCGGEAFFDDIEKEARGACSGR